MFTRKYHLLILINNMTTQIEFIIYYILILKPLNNACVFEMRNDYFAANMTHIFKYLRKTTTWR